MYGLEAIMHHNGFAMAAVGVTIVFSALVALSLIISQLHKVLFVLENRQAWTIRARRRFTHSKSVAPMLEETQPLVTVHYYDDIYESARQFNLLIQTMGEPFSLPELIRRAEARGIAHAHSTVSHLLVSRLIIPDPEGFFLWNNEAYKKLLRQRKY